MCRQVRVDEEERRRLAEVEADLNAAFVTHQIRKSSCNVGRLIVPDVFVQRSMGEDHDVHRTHPMSSNLGVLLTQMVGKLLLPAAFVLKNHGLFDRPLAFASAHHIYVVPQSTGGRDPRTNVVWCWLPVEIPRPAKDAQLIASWRAPCLGHALFPMVEGGKTVRLHWGRPNRWLSLVGVVVVRAPRWLLVTRAILFHLLLHVRCPRSLR
mmetsp:Transcript_71896/g.156625  ORF Transcript_71896/g.156625 Transcript_71896/m.156625 type:complete len:209 (+) Transcript_71896:1053-1679(+)